MRRWATLLGAAAAIGAAAVAVGVMWQRSRAADRSEDIPQLIADCFERIHRIERELQRLKPAETPG